MLDKVRVFMFPVSLEGKTGMEAKDIAKTKEQYKEHQDKLNRALDSAVFSKFSSFMGDSKFDIDKVEDRKSMKVVLERHSKIEHDELRKQAVIDALSLLQELDAIYEAKKNADNDVINNTRNELRSGVLADLNNDLVEGTQIKREKKFNRIEKKQDNINQFQKDAISEIQSVLTERLGANDAMLVKSFIDKGVLTRTRFEKGLADMYLDTKFPHYENASKPAKKEMKKKAKEWADNVSDVLKEGKLWKAAKQVNIMEKAEDRMEGRKQKATKENKEETLYTEQQLKWMIDETAMIMGKDKFAKALWSKMNQLNPGTDLLKWDNMAGLNQALDNPKQRDLIQSTIKNALPMLTVSGMKEWIENENPGVLLNAYKAEIEKQHTQAIDNVLESMMPNSTPDKIRKARGEVIAGIAAGLMHVVDKNAAGGGVEIKGAGLGAGVTFTGIDRVTPLVSRISIGAGLGVGIDGNPIPGFAVDFGKDIKWKTGAMHLDAGASNFIIPFARFGIDQSLFNNKKLQQSLTAKRVFKVGAYAEATPGYAGVGINVGNNLVEGINRQEVYVERNIMRALDTIEENMSLNAVKQLLKVHFAKANDALLTEVATHTLNGLKQGYSKEDIAATFTNAWKQEAIKNTRGKVDFSIEGGVGTLMTVPVLKAFVGLKFYKRSVMLTDKYDRDAKEQMMSTLTRFEPFDNADVEGKSTTEKIAYWFGTEAIISEDKNTITIAINDAKTPIYDKFDVYVRDHAAVSVTADKITFSKASDIFMGKLIESDSYKRKIFIGYDQRVDTDPAKSAINAEIHGKPQDVIRRTTDVIVEAQSLSFDVKERANIYADYFNKAKFKCIEATNQVQAKKYEYNTYCQDLFIEINRYMTGKATTEQFNDVMGSFNQLMNRIGAGTLNVKDTDPRNEIINQMLNTIAYSAKAWNLNAANPNTLKGKNMPKDIPSLINRKGALEAFRKGGYELKANEFDALHATAKGEVLYKQVTYPNAIAAVSYYRNVAPKTPMNMTALTGFNAVTLAHSNKSGEILKDNAVDAKTQDKLMSDLINNPLEFAAFEARVAAMLTTAGIDADTFNHEDYVALLKGEKVHGVTLNKSFFKAFNGPCVNEAIVMNLLGIHIDTYTEKKPREGDVYVSMEHTDNWNKSKHINAGIGAMYGNKPQQPPKEGTPGTPGSVPVDSGTKNPDGSSNGGLNPNPSDKPNTNGNDQTP